MSSGFAIQAERLGKKYVIRRRSAGTYEESYTLLRDVLRDRAARLASYVARLPGRSSASIGPRAGWSEFWALDDVSFTIRPGERVGIIGRNGAGKSTLLKVLSRITEPTTGYARIRGRVSSLLEVGAGFHLELTGRENIFLNGAILGMTRADIRARFDEIVAFAEIERFLDTPVKRYSSGMFMRLAFAVAAHLEPEILIVDEVLAVGDASFQKKCLNKMEDVGKAGRTVLFVSHSMPAITRLCERAILLDSGRVLDDGPAPQVVSTYLQSGLGTTALREWQDLEQAPGDDVARLRAVRVRAADGRIRDSLDIRRPVEIEVEYDVLRAGHVLVPNLHLFVEDGVCAFATLDLDPDWHGRARPAGRFISTAHIPGNFLAEGNVLVTVYIATFNPLIAHVTVPDAVAFQVVDSLDGDSARGHYGGAMPGVLRPLLRWTNRHIPVGDLDALEVNANSSVPQ